MQRMHFQRNSTKPNKPTPSLPKEKQQMNTKQNRSIGLIQITKNTKPWNLIKLRAQSASPMRYDTRGDPFAVATPWRSDQASSPRTQNARPKMYNVLLDMEPSKYLKDLYEHCPNFEENVPIYGSPKSNWDLMTYFIMNKSTDEVRKKFQMAHNYVEKKQSKDSIVRLMALSMVKKGEINDREPHFPFHFQNVKENQLKKMEQEHQRHKSNKLRMMEMQKKLNKSKVKRERKLMKQLRGKSLREVQSLLNQAREQRQNEEQKRQQTQTPGDDNRQLTRQKNEIMNKMTINVLEKIMANTEQNKRLDKTMISQLFNQEFEEPQAEAPVNLPLRRTRTRMFKGQKRPDRKQNSKRMNHQGESITPNSNEDQNNFNLTPAATKRGNDDDSFLQTDSSRDQLEEVNEVPVPEQKNDSSAQIAKDNQLRPPPRFNLLKTPNAAQEKLQNMYREIQQRDEEHKQKTEKGDERSIDSVLRSHLAKELMKRIQQTIADNIRLQFQKDFARRVIGKSDKNLKLQSRASEESDPRHSQECSFGPSKKQQLQKILTQKEQDGSVRESPERSHSSKLQIMSIKSGVTAKKSKKSRLSKGRFESLSSVELSSSSKSLESDEPNNSGDKPDQSADDTSLDSDKVKPGSDSDSVTYSFTSSYSNRLRKPSLEQIEETDDSNYHDSQSRFSKFSRVTRFSKLTPKLNHLDKREERRDSTGNTLQQQRQDKRRSNVYFEDSRDLFNFSQIKVLEAPSRKASKPAQQQPLSPIELKLRNELRRQSLLSDHIQQFIESQIGSNIHQMHKQATHFLSLRLRHKPNVNLRLTSENHKKIKREARKPPSTFTSPQVAKTPLRLSVLDNKVQNRQTRAPKELAESPLRDFGTVGDKSEDFKPAGKKQQTKVNNYQSKQEATGPAKCAERATDAKGAVDGQAAQAQKQHWPFVEVGNQTSHIPRNQISSLMFSKRSKLDMDQSAPMFKNFSNIEEKAVKQYQQQQLVQSKLQQKPSAAAQKAHSNNMADFVSNYEQVQQYARGAKGHQNTRASYPCSKPSASPQKRGRADSSGSAHPKSKSRLTQGNKAALTSTVLFRQSQEAKFSSFRPSWVAQSQPEGPTQRTDDHQGTADHHIRSQSNCDHLGFQLESQAFSASQNRTINHTMTRQNSLEKHSPEGGIQGSTINIDRMDSATKDYNQLPQAESAKAYLYPSGTQSHPQRRRIISQQFQPYEAVPKIIIMGRKASQKRYINNIVKKENPLSGVGNLGANLTVGDDSNYRGDTLDQFLDMYDKQAVQQVHPSKPSEAKNSGEAAPRGSHPGLNFLRNGPYSSIIKIRRRKHMQSHSKPSSTRLSQNMVHRSVGGGDPIADQLNESMRSTQTLNFARSHATSGTLHRHQKSLPPGQQAEQIYQIKKKKPEKPTFPSYIGQSAQTIKTQIRSPRRSVASSGQPLTIMQTEESTDGAKPAHGNPVNYNRGTAENGFIHLSNTNCDATTMSSLNEKQRRMHQFMNRQNQKISALNMEFGSSQKIATEYDLAINHNQVNFASSVANGRAHMVSRNKFKGVKHQKNCSTVPEDMGQANGSLNMYFLENESIASVRNHQ